MDARRRAISVWGVRLVVVVWLVGLAAVCVAAQPKPGEFTGPHDETQRIQQLISQLGNKEYSVRQRAQEELARFGFTAFEALSEAANHSDFEIASRARYLLRLIRSQWVGEKDPPEAQKLLEGYELLGVNERAWRIGRLVRLPRFGGIPVVCRLIRFEKSETLAAHAALEILYYEPSDREAWAKLASALRENLAGSQRRPAQWLLTYVALRENPSDVLEKWSKLVAEEQQLFRSSPERSVRGAAAMLTYLLAEGYARAGQKDKAEETASQARQLGGTGEAGLVRARLQIALALRRRGLDSWAEAEYRQVAEKGAIVDRVAAFVYLSEMLHDRGQSLRAAEARREGFQALKNLAPALREQVHESLLLYGIDAADVAARMYYFEACHWKQQGDRAKQRQLLNDAIQTNPAEIDTLIALAKLPDQTEAEREKTQRLIDKAVLMLRRDIEEDPEDANAYNQAAWLMGNTQKDLDEALRLAKKANELSPDNGAYLDTLAHVYFAKGDLENAIRYQERAVEVEPHSAQLVNALKAFRAAAEERGKDRAATRAEK
jgi:tetratricopeptide (TPR) repeat protein